MKRLRMLFYTLMFLPLVLTLVALIIMPDQVPMHYDLSGSVNRWGSKYENLVFPLITVLMGVFFLTMRKFYVGKTGEKEGNVLFGAGSGTLAVFNVMTILFLVKALRLSSGDVFFTLDISRILYAALGVALLVTGNVLPKLRRNGFAGVRTAWSRESDENWRLSQIAGGTVLAAAGAVLLIGNVFFVREADSNLFSLLCLVLTIPILAAVLEILKIKKERV